MLETAARTNDGLVVASIGSNSPISERIHISKAYILISKDLLLYSAPSEAMIIPDSQTESKAVKGAITGI